MGPISARNTYFLIVITVHNPDMLAGWYAFNVDLAELLEQSRPPDSELVDLIEQAFLEGQIDSQTADLAYLWLMATRE